MRLIFSPRFHEESATELASWFLQWAGGTMNILKLVKLLYIADRRALAWLGWPITFDSFASMEHGPVPSRTYNLMNEELPPEAESIWGQFIDERQRHDISLIKPPERRHLSDAQFELAREVWEEFKDYDQWQLRDYTHTFSEWQAPEENGPQSLPLPYEAVLQAVGKSPEEITAILTELDEERMLDGFLSPVI